MTNGDEINAIFKPCSCNSTGGCEKCRPKININNYYYTYIPSEFEKYKYNQNKLKN